MFAKKYDVVVVGGGPAGAMAALEAARGGLQVAIFERKIHIGQPVRCGELIRKASAAFFLPELGDWIVSSVDAYRIVGPNLSSISYEEEGMALVLDRKIFDRKLIDLALEQGAELFLETEVIDLIKKGEKVCGISVKNQNSVHEIMADIVIAADGISSRMARLAGIDSHLPVKGLAATISARLTDFSTTFTACELHFGKKTAPGGYLWLFPTSKHTANIGIGINGNLSKHKSSLAHIQQFFKKHYPKGKIHEVVCGGIPVYQHIQQFSCPGMVLIGDAARLTNPLTGAGIFLAMLSGKLAGQAITKGAKEGIEHYTELCREKILPLHMESLAARTQLNRASDEALSLAIQSMSPFATQTSVARALIQLANAV